MTLYRRITQPLGRLRTGAKPRIALILLAVLTIPAVTGTAEGQGQWRAPQKASGEAGPTSPAAPLAAPSTPGAIPAVPNPAFFPPPDSVPDGSGFFQAPGERYLGPGQPMLRESWSFRPLSAGPFVGYISGGELIDDWVGQGSGWTAGMRLGWDFDPYWGCETRFAFASVEVTDSARAISLGVTRFGPEPRRDNEMFFWDVDMLYYPWGDSRWRPYLSLGLGLATVEFADRFGNVWDDALFALPLGMGMKCQVNEFLAFRLDLADHIVFGGGDTIETFGNFTLTGGVECRFGGHRRAYWPWNPSRHYW